MLDANWQTGKYIVEYELKGKDRAEYGRQLLVNLAKDLTARNGKGFSRSNLVYMRKFYLAFPICETVSHKLTWSHYFELLKCDNALEMQFYYKESIKECWKVRELKRQMKSCLFQRFALSRDCRLIFFTLSEAATNPFNFCVRLIKISILYLFPVVSAGFFVRFSWRGYSSPTRVPH